MENIISRIGKIKIKDKKSVYLVLSLLFIFWPFIYSSVYCAMGHHLISDIYIPSGSWNDEVFYFKQIDAMIKYGIPKGFFGYNETHAMNLSFGSWSIFILLPYAVFGKLFGWHFISPIIANLIFMSSASAILWFAIRPNKKQITLFLLFWAGSPLLIRYSLSAMSESLFYALIMICFAEIFRFYDKPTDRYYIALLVTISYLTLCRPYYEVLILFIIIRLFYKDMIDKRIKYTFIMIVQTFITLPVYYFSNKYLCAPYFSPIINTEFIDEFKKSIPGGIKYVYDKVALAVSQVGIGISNRDCFSTYILLVAILLLFIIITYILQKREFSMKLQSICILGIIFLTMAVLYNINTGERHELPFCILCALTVIFEENDENIFKYVIFGLLCIWAVIMPKSAMIFHIPYNTEETMKNEIRLSNEFNNAIKVTDDIGWQNTVDLCAPYQICYYMPAGIGINMVIPDKIEQPYKAKYILTDYNGKTSEDLIKQGAEASVSQDGWTLFINNENIK